MYAGPFDVKAQPNQDNHHLFYWFFKNVTLPDTAPLVLWMNGGPGSTSMFGLWLENGPLRVRQTGQSMDNFNVFLKAEGSWGDVSDVIFLDQPAGTGWSWYDVAPVNRLEDAGIEV